jgi:sugar O-acyltransferase (sialic acid O-acetyltransferase NeuD family)
MKPTILIVGAGGHGRSVAELVLTNGDFKLCGFVDDRVSGAVFGVPMLGRTEDLARLRSIADCAFVAIGNNALRERLHALLLRANFTPVTLIHPAALVSQRAVLGAGTVVMAGAIVGTEAVLGIGVILNSGAVVDHHCRLADYSHLGAGAVMAGGSTLGRRAWVQAGASLGYGVEVNEDAILRPGEGRERGFA